jgi:hypothetical protein
VASFIWQDTFASAVLHVAAFAKDAPFSVHGHCAREEERARERERERERVRKEVLYNGINTGITDNKPD